MGARTLNGRRDTSETGALKKGRIVRNLSLFRPDRAFFTAFCSSRRAAGTAPSLADRTAGSLLPGPSGVSPSVACGVRHGRRSSTVALADRPLPAHRPRRLGRGSARHGVKTRRQGLPRDATPTRRRTRPETRRAAHEKKATTANRHRTESIRAQRLLRSMIYPDEGRQIDRITSSATSVIALNETIPGRGPHLHRPVRMPRATERSRLDSDYPNERIARGQNTGKRLARKKPCRVARQPKSRLCVASRELTPHTLADTGGFTPCFVPCADARRVGPDPARPSRNRTALCPGPLISLTITSCPDRVSRSCVWPSETAFCSLSLRLRFPTMLAR